MRTDDIALLDLGCSNLFSLVTALEKCGERPRVVSSASEIAETSRLILPGVGRFAAGVAAIERLGVREALVERIKRDLPTAAICLGMQLLFSGSDESPGAAGLGVLSEVIEPVFPNRTAHFGWDRLGSPATPTYVYFTHSYCARGVAAEWNPVYSGSGQVKPFVGQISKGKIFGCQFHPEISGIAGYRLLKEWLACSKDSPCL